MTIVATKSNTKDLLLSDNDLRTINDKNELSYASVESIFKRSNFSFDDIEKINNHFETYKWGSQKDRIYRKKSIELAIKSFGENPKKYIL